MMSTPFSTRNVGRSSWPGSRSTVKLQRSMIRRFGLSPDLRSAAAPSTRRRKPLFISGAPPVMSRTCTLGEFLRRIRQRSTTSGLICSVRSGDDSTWQCVHAWLQYRPMFSCSVRERPRLNSLTPASAMNFLNGGAPTAASACARRSSSSSGFIASCSSAAVSSRSCKASGMRLVRSLVSEVGTCFSAFAASAVIRVMSTGPYSYCRRLRRASTRYMAGVAIPAAAMRAATGRRPATRSRKNAMHSDTNELVPGVPAGTIAVPAAIAGPGARASAHGCGEPV
mmetsp:Transcript_103528/g.267769  ORF Transcript_103528/g.267769 Transcript_103528/m.267769 type:complete len:282 (-) Transcript_103528:4-849(-)